MQVNLKNHKVSKAYNGKTGCACGCRGTYVDSGKALTQRVNKVMSFVGPMRPDAANFGDKASFSSKPFCGDRYVYVQDGDRVTCVYFS